MTESTLLGIGEALRAQRLKKSMTVENVAQETRISTRFLRALEDEKWEELPAKVYLEGFLKQYAAFLGLPGEDLLKQYRESRGEAAKTAAPKEAAAPVAKPAPIEEAKSSAALLLAVALLALGGGAFFIHKMRENPAPAQEQPAVPRAETPIQPPPLPILPPTKHAFLVQARESVWLRVWVDDAVQFEGILRQGRSRNWTGEKSYRVQASDLSRVDVTVDGAPLKPVVEGASQVRWNAEPSLPPQAASPAENSPQREPGASPGVGDMQYRPSETAPSNTPPRSDQSAP